MGGEPTGGRHTREEGKALIPVRVAPARAWGIYRVSAPRQPFGRGVSLWAFPADGWSRLRRGRVLGGHGRPEPRLPVAGQTVCTRVGRLFSLVLGAPARSEGNAATS
jgi:hypothetical protein